MPTLPTPHQVFASFVASRLKSPRDINFNLTDADCHLIHMALGLAGEVGELVDAIKKKVIYKKPLDTANVAEELGDIEFFLEGLRQALDMNRAAILNANIDKLSQRYPVGYSDADAAARADKQVRS